jgi:hypothetical protein
MTANKVLSVLLGVTISIIVGMVVGIFAWCDDRRVSVAVLAGLVAFGTAWTAWLSSVQTYG